MHVSTDTIKAKSLFLNAVERCPPEEWRAFLDRECGEDIELRQQVERLLAGHRNDVDLVEQGQAAFNHAIPTLAEAAVQEHPGDTIGPFKLREQLGEGGMGSSTSPSRPNRSAAKSRSRSSSRGWTPSR